MESGPLNCRLAGWLGGEELNLCHQHTSMLTKSILESFGRLGSVWMGSGSAGSWPEERRSNTATADLATNAGGSSHLRPFTLPCQWRDPWTVPTGTLRAPLVHICMDIFPFHTLRGAGAELLPWVLVSCSYSGPDTEGPAVDWSLVAGTADLLRLLGAHVHSLFLFPSVHAERRGETSPPEGQNILAALGEGIPVPGGEGWEGGREPSNPSQMWLQLLTSEKSSKQGLCL